MKEIKKEEVLRGDWVIERDSLSDFCCVCLVVSVEGDTFKQLVFFETGRMRINKMNYWSSSEVWYYTKRDSQ